MKPNKLFILIILIFLFSQSLKTQKIYEIDQDYCKKKDVCGKVVGWIIDPITNEPVKEEFSIDFYYLKEPEIIVHSNTKSDASGYFENMLYPGEYYLRVIPLSDSSKFCFEPNPYKIPENTPVIEVRRGKITEIFKKASIGGNVKVILIDPSGQKINFNEVLKGVKFSVYITNELTGDGSGTNVNVDHPGDKSEFLFTNLFPGEYKVTLTAPSGFGNSTKRGVLIEKNKTNEIQLSLDLNTGIEGKVTDLIGNPLKSINIDIRSVELSEDYTYDSFWTNEGGYYRFINLKEGLYNLSYGYEIDGVIYEGKIESVFIEKNKIIKKNILINTEKKQL